MKFFVVALFVQTTNRVEPSEPHESAAEKPLTEAVESVAAISTTGDASLKTEDTAAAGK